MGKQVVEITKVLDDLDGSDLSSNPPEPQTITFDGKDYEVYMSARSTERLLDFLTGTQPLTKSSGTAARATSTGKRGPNRTPEEIAADAANKEAKKAQRAEIQQWAKTVDGFAVPGEKGVIKADLLEAFYKAHPKAERHF